MTAQFPRLFSPVAMRGHTLRNRIVFGAHTANMAQGGMPGEQHVAYYAERAMGGAGMIVVEPMPVHAATVLTRGNFRHADDAVIPHFRNVTDAIRSNGAVAIQQLYHVGPHGDSDLSFHSHWSPSGTPSYHDSDGSHAMTEAEILETIDGFVAAARRCKEAGFQGVEVWAAYLGLVDQFWTPWTNRREDQWGGSLKNRTRFSRTILSRIREACGDDFIVGLAISDQPGAQVALTREEHVEIVGLHDDLGLIDYVTCGSGGYVDYPALMPTFLLAEKLGADLATQIRQRVKTALITAESHIRTPENAETVLGEGAADLVSIVRGQIADPHLARKAEEGRPDDIRPCLSCNQMCWGRRSRDYWISCVVNPSVGREWEWGGDRFSPAPAPLTVLVVGAGPAGLEAARAAAERGHSVIVAEAADRIGGAFRLAGLQPRRAQILDLLDWYERQLAALGVDLRLNAPLDAEEIAAIAADRVILATGSLSPETGFQKALPAQERLPGMAQGNVFTVEQVMSREARPGHRVLVLDEAGHWRGAGTAWKLAEDGHAVTVLTPDAFVGKELARTTADLPLRARLRQLGADWRTEVSVAEWHGDGATIVDHTTGARSRIDADSLVLATTNIAADCLAGELAAMGIAFTAIGDCAAPRLVPFAIHEGRRAGMAL
ncbi:FAD-dependent oxidoreductase [Novosphingobium sp. CCH12-A3]|uniref:oxidoreductase n=1 Tax=Novosphingobium sp. CCH12-A3 TaxID=1768752 RepID=UPI000783ACE0|nr:FAD-dependent oxidoreductase [Novosphingobium sp. CCH12-A3]